VSSHFSRKDVTLFEDTIPRGHHRMFNLCVASSLGSMFLPGEGEAISILFSAASKSLFDDFDCFDEFIMIKKKIKSKRKLGCMYCIVSDLGRCPDS